MTFISYAVEPCDGAAEVPISVANTWQAIATYTPPSVRPSSGCGSLGLFLVLVYVTVPAGGATVAVRVPYTDSAGAQTATLLSSTALPAGPWSGSAVISSAPGAQVTAEVESSVATSTIVTAALVGL